jgi:hypothetical protein
MHELTCPGCGSASQYNLKDFILTCSYCSVSFQFDPETSRKEMFSDHYIVPNKIDAQKAKESVLEWLRRIHHKSGHVEREFIVLGMKGVSLPFWIVSLEVHTKWKGLSKRLKHIQDVKLGSDYLQEDGTFKRTYRWAVNARNNICEYWGLERLHEPKEDINVFWDGFPLDSTFSKGQISAQPSEVLTAYDSREFFEFKYANGLPVLGAQVSDEDAVRRAKSHVESYHQKLARLHADLLIDCRMEVDIAGIQLIHLPFWSATYAYRPSSFLRHLKKPTEKHLTLEGVNGGVIKAELAIVHKDKVQVNAIVCAAASVTFFLLGAVWSSAFFLVSLFFAMVSGISLYIAFVRSDNFKRRVEHITPESLAKVKPVS